MHNIRVTYSGLIAFGVSLFSIITGTIFGLVITRKLTLEEFGSWSLIGNLLTYVGIFELMISYWIIRQVSRGVESPKTALFTSGLFSIIGMAVFILIAVLTSGPTNANVDIMLFSIILIPAFFVNNVLVTINLGWKPQVTNYGILVLQISKVLMIILTTYWLEMGLYGVIISIFFGYIFSSVVHAYLAKEKLRGAFKFQYIKHWLKSFWIPSYIFVGNIIERLDLLIFSLMTGSVIGLAYYGAALIMADVLRHSSAFYHVLYPKLLEGGDRNYMKDSIVRFFYIAFPLLAVIITFAKPSLYVLNPIYVIAAPVIIFLSIREFLRLFQGIFGFGLQGIEQVDYKQNPSFRQLLNSKLFFVQTVRIIKYSLYIGLLVIIIFIYQNDDETQIKLVIYWAALSMVIEIPVLIYLYSVSKKDFDLRLPIMTIIKYALTSSLIFTFIYLLMEEFLEYDENIIKFLLILLGYVMLGITIYLGITYLIDNRTKILFNAIFSEIKNIIKK